MPQIVITREFDAPRDLVFHAYTDPELLVQWLGPRDLTMTIDQYDVRDGGKWRYVSKDAEGNEYGFHVAAGDWSAADAERVISMIGRDNARRACRL
ncbi:MAG: hypothetical protein QOE54_238 [Streptosporangiaceae bacterium]|jgi:uncharacterized protein YndB with AHSA1/START domain|nr:hypothetical protein [Streptosporangiaceae bacterium]